MLWRIHDSRSTFYQFTKYTRRSYLIYTKYLSISMKYICIISNSNEINLISDAQCLSLFWSNVSIVLSWHCILNEEKRNLIIALSVFWLECSLFIIKGINYSSSKTNYKISIRKLTNDYLHRTRTFIDYISWISGDKATYIVKHLYISGSI